MSKDRGRGPGFIAGAAFAMCGCGRTRVFPCDPIRAAQGRFPAPPGWAVERPALVTAGPQAIVVRCPQCNADAGRADPPSMDAGAKRG